MAEAEVVLNQNTTVGAEVRTETQVIGGKTVHQQVITVAKADGTLDPPTVLAAGSAVIGHVIVDSAGTPIAVTGTFWQATQPVSGSVGVTSLPAGLATGATQTDGTQRTGIVGTVPLPTGAALDATVQTTADRFAPSIGGPTVVTASGDTTVYTPATGKRVRLKWVGLSSPSTNGASVRATLKWSGATGTIYIWEMGAPGAFAHGVVRVGAVNESLVVNLSGAQTVDVNLDVVEF